MRHASETMSPSPVSSTVHGRVSCEVPEAYPHYPKLHLLVRLQFSEGGNGAHAHQQSLVQSTGMRLPPASMVIRCLSPTRPLPYIFGRAWDLKPLVHLAEPQLYTLDHGGSSRYV